MAEGGTKKEFEEIADGIVSNLTEAMDFRFQQTNERIGQLEERMGAFEKKLDKLTELLDHFLNRLTDFDIEYKTP